MGRKLHLGVIGFMLNILVVVLAVACGGGSGGIEGSITGNPTSINNNVPTMESIGNQVATVGQLFSLQVVARDPDNNVLSFSLSLFPEGMVVSETGLISWTPGPAQGGNHTVAVVADDGLGGEASRSFTISVSGGLNNPPVVEGIVDQSGTVGEVFAYSVVASDPDGDTLTYEQVVGPASMIVSASTGQISWVPAAGDVGYTRVTISVSDPQGGTSYVSFRVCVPLPGNRPPTIPELVNQSATEDEPTASYGNILINDPDGDSLTYTLFLDYSDAPPAWIQMTMITGGVNIYWNPPSNPTSSGDYQLTLMADDGRGGIDTRTFDLKVSAQPGVAVAANNAPVFDAGATPNNLKVDSLNVFRTYVIASDPDGDSIVFTVRDAATSQAVSGLAINTRMSLSGNTPVATGVIEWRPTRAQVKSGTYDLEVVASDGHDGLTIFHLLVDVNMASIKNQAIRIGTGAGEEYNYPLPHIGASYTWTLDSAPGWLSMNPAGPAANTARLTGTIPAAPASSSVQFSIKNASGTVVDVLNFNIEVATSVKSLSDAAEPTTYEKLDANALPYCGDIFLRDWNGDGKDDVLISADGTSAVGGQREIYRWTRLVSDDFGLREDFNLYSTPGYFSTDDLWYGGAGSKRYNPYSLERVSHFASGSYYHAEGQDLVYIVNAGGGCTVYVLPLDFVDNTPLTNTPYVSFQTSVAGSPGTLEIADVYNAPPLGDGTDYDNGYELVFVVSDTRQVVVMNGKGVVTQTLDLSHTTCDNSDYAYRMAPGDFDGDGLQDLAVTTWEQIDDAVEGYLRSVARVEIFLQESVGGTYKLVSKGLYTLDIANSPRTTGIYDFDFLRAVRGLSAGDLNGDGVDEFAVAYQKWAGQWPALRYNNFYANYGYIKVYQYGALSEESVTPSTALQTINEKARVWVSTMTSGPAGFQVRYTEDDGANWTSFTSSTTSAFNVAINCISSTHRNPIAADSAIVFDKRYYWFGTNGKGLVRYDGNNTWTNLTLSSTTSALAGPGLLNEVVQTVEMLGGTDDGSGWSNRLFVGTQNGLYRWGGDATTFNQDWTSMQGLADQDVRVMTASEWNTTYPAATGYYKAIICSTGQTRYDKDNVTPTAGIDTKVVGAVDGYLTMDDQYIRWYATDRGVASHQGLWGATYRYFTTSSGSTFTTTSLGDNMTGIVDAGPGTRDGTNWYSTRWVCTSSAGAARMYDNVDWTVDTAVSSRWEYFTTSNGLPSAECTRVDIDSRQNVWVGTRNGLVRFGFPTASPWTTYTPTTFLSGMEVHDVYVEPHIWNQIADIKIADVTGDGKMDLVVASNGFVFSYQDADEGRHQDRGRPISPKINIVGQEYVSGNYKLVYRQNAPYREVYLNKIYQGVHSANFYMPYRRRVISIGDVDGNGYDDIGISINYGTQRWSDATRLNGALIYKMVVE